MSIIKLSEDDPMVSATRILPAPSLTEVGFIPGDQYGCKLYGQKYADGVFRIVGLHSQTYGCPIKQTVGVEIIPSTLRN